MVCFICTKSVTCVDIGIECCNKDCSKLHHASCIGLSTRDIDFITSNKLYWLCVNCKSTSKTLISLQDIKVQNKTTVVSESVALIEQLNEKIDLLKKELNELIQEPLLALISQINLNASRICNLVEQQETFTHKQESIEKHQKRLNIEINGIPFVKGENLSAILLKICELIEQPSLTSEILDVKRIRSQSNKIQKPIIVSFSNLRARNNFLYLSKSSKKLLLSELNFSSNNKFFVNEHLTAAKKEILYHVKISKDILQIKKFFVKSGRIFINTVDSKEPLEISSLNQLKNFLVVQQQSNNDI